MQFVRVNNLIEGAQTLSDRLIHELSEHKRVLWLVSGGSNIPVSVTVMNKIPNELTENLSIYLTDERFGPVGHPDSNLQQLIDAGFQPKDAQLEGVLMPGVAFEETVERYDQAIVRVFEQSDVIIGQFGIGADGHIAGILPGSDSVNSKELVDGYSTETYTRITLTPEALLRVSIGYAYVSGDTKLTALTNLRDKDLPITEQPSQILKQIPEAYVYSDQLGDNIDDPIITKGDNV
jgi:6-phosphogluconolactonase/glucosamine-6-phosphate isomerase/deaminase